MIKKTISDELSIIGTFIETPTWATIETIAKHSDYGINEITRMLENNPDTKKIVIGLRRANKNSINEANERHREKSISKKKERKVKKNEGWWKLSTSVSKAVELKTTPEQNNLLYSYYQTYKNLATFIKEGEAQSKECKTPYDYVKNFRAYGNDVSAHWLSSAQRMIINTVLPTAIRGVYLGKVSFPVGGKQTGRDTSSDIDVEFTDGKYYLVFANERIEILYQDHDEYYGKDIAKKLHDLWKGNIVCGGWILRAKSGKWYAKFGIPRKPSDFTWDVHSKKVFIMIQPTFNELGIVWNAKYFNEANQQIFKACLLHADATIRLRNIKKDYRTVYVASAIQKVFRIWHERFQTMQPIVILQETVGKAPSLEAININPTYKLQMKLCDKLAQVNGMGANRSGVNPFDIECARKSLGV
jgi:hypothetical protein